MQMDSKNSNMSGDISCLYVYVVSWVYKATHFQKCLWISIIHLLTVKHATLFSVYLGQGIDPGLGLSCFSLVCRSVDHTRPLPAANRDYTRGFHHPFGGGGIETPCITVCAHIGWNLVWSIKMHKISIMIQPVSHTQTSLYSSNLVYTFLEVEIIWRNNFSN